MPLWRIFHPGTTFTTPEEKKALADDITTIYASRGLPAFYVIVLFVPLPSEQIFVGGVPNNAEGAKPFIRIVYENIARRLPNSELKVKLLDRIDAALKPHIADKGYDWEYHGVETDRELWKIQGYYPPPNGSEEEKLWVKENKAVPYGPYLKL